MLPAKKRVAPNSSLPGWVGFSRNEKNDEAGHATRLDRAAVGYGSQRYPTLSLRDRGTALGVLGGVRVDLMFFIALPAGELRVGVIDEVPRRALEAVVSTRALQWLGWPGRSHCREANPQRPKDQKRQPKERASSTLGCHPRSDHAEHGEQAEPDDEREKKRGEREGEEVEGGLVTHDWNLGTCELCGEPLSRKPLGQRTVHCAECLRTGKGHGLSVAERQEHRHRQYKDRGE
jgi:hypothetical protein